jgi:cytochrome P450
MELNPFAYEFHDDPYPTYTWLREQAPLYRNEKLDFWALSRFRDVLSGLVDWKTYSSAEGILLERLDPRMFDVTPMMIFMDPPRHDRLRRLVSHAFTARRVADLELLIRDTAVRLVDQLDAAGGGDFVKDLSGPFPMEVIFTLIGVPDADRGQLRAWTDQALDRDPDRPDIPPRAVEASLELMRYWFGLLEDLRRRPNDGLMCALMDAEVSTDDGSTTRLSDGEIVGFCSLLGGAGTETTTKLLGYAAVLFARHLEAYDTVRADHTRLPGAVEELLRYTSPAQYAARTVTRDVEWYGQIVPKNSRLLFLIGAANRDPAEFDRPDTFDINRNISQALGFGQGVHFCLGANLARLETRIALEEFMTRFPRYTVDEARCERVHMSNVHGYASVPFARC